MIGQGNRRMQGFRIPLKKIALAVDGKIIGDEDLIITGINSLGAAVQGDITFFADKRYKAGLENTGASALIVREENNVFKGAQVVVSDPKLAYVRVAEFFATAISRYPGISERAFVSETSCVGKNVSIYPLVYVGEKAVIGDDVILFPGVYIGNEVRIGSGTVVYPNVSILERCVIGKNVIIHAGTVIGSDGYGYARDGAVSVKIPQLGIVRIEDHVEIGANNSIDRAALGKTWIGRGVKTDNFVHIAHNVVIGENTIIVAQVGISGSTQIGKNVIIGGQVGIIDHLKIDDGVMIGPKTGVVQDIAKGEVVMGYTAMPHKLFLKTAALTRQLPDLYNRLRTVEKRLKEMDKESEKE